MKKMPDKSAKSGQVIIIVLLILVVVLTIGLSVATRTVTDIKTAKQTELSNRAFNAAEAGVEAALSGQRPTGNITVGSGVNTSTYNVDVTTVGGETGREFIFNKPIAKDDTQQIWFVGHDVDTNAINTADPLNFNSPQFYVYWGNNGVDGGTSTTPALEVSVIYKEVDYKMVKAVYDPNNTRVSTNNFINTGVETGSYTSSQLRFRTLVDLQQAPFNISSWTDVTLYAVRLRLLYNDSPQMLGAQPFSAGDTFPVQGKLISSTGNAGNVYRKVEVFESFPALPPIFDYVIFNGSSNSLQKN